MWPLLPKKCDCENTGTNTSENAICNHCGLTTNDLVYTGTNTECTQVNTGDTVSVAFQKIDYFICGGGLAQQILNQLQNNIEEYPDFITLVNGVVSCDVINACGEPPTTTTTTTTVIYNCNMTGEATLIGCDLWQYRADLYNCEDCSNITTNIPVISDEELVIENWYLLDSGFKVFITSFETCATEGSTVNVIASSSSANCLDIICPTTTTTTTVLDCTSYSYDVDLYVCETCELTGAANINNSEELTIGGFYNWEGFTIQVTGFVECLGTPPISFILDSTVQNNCIDVPCPTTTTTTTI